jgi:hypothetical protein
MITKSRPLIPPLARTNPGLKRGRLNHKPPSIIDPSKLPVLEKRQSSPPEPSTPAKPVEPHDDSRSQTSDPSIPPAGGSPSSRRPLRCRECGTRTSWPAAGWYQLRRRILRNSIPPEILNEAECRAWARQTEQWMGCYCSLACIEKSMMRLKELDKIFRQNGVGTELAPVEGAIE